MNPKIFILLLVCTSVALACDKKDCHDLPGQEVCYDDKCSSGESLGCNAGGQGQNCRFCGFGDFPKCP
ncbi:hypothetical protein L596_016366 [Steinernema carpocapsae]|uniref:Laminin EGF-like domain-containing protein n=1 Tax=Steinernema carpocapsae TaxID=34508 RepID=A0A4U5NHK0_STECR|nr:hypothetical protein L596_016257 [Steinernema carpocapsae]TKR82678.1 hypothetical protein L596_016366 [Steinernema carpocapsae]